MEASDIKRYLKFLCEELAIEANSYLGLPMRNNKFKDGHYTKLERHIKKKLSDQPNIVGVGVSKSKLKELLKYGFNISIPISSAKLNTLDKVAIFLGYNSWGHFIEKKEQENKLSIEAREKQLESDFLNAKQKEIVIIGQLNNELLLKEYFVEGGPYYRMLTEKLKHISENDMRYASKGKLYRKEKFQIIELNHRSAFIAVNEYDALKEMELRETNEWHSKTLTYSTYELLYVRDSWKILDKHITTFNTQWVLWDDLLDETET